MNRRFISGLLIVLLGLQAIMVAPAVVVASNECPSQTGKADDECPCCPQGVALEGCATACTAIVAPVAAITNATISPVPVASVPFVPGAIFSQTYPPLDPPPIG